EIASLFFLSLIDEADQPAIIDMIVAHHKSIYQDAGSMGILDLEDTIDACFEKHAIGFESWMPDALAILQTLGLQVKPVTLAEAKDSYHKVVDYCNKRNTGYSLWKGVLMAADHLVSAIDVHQYNIPQKLFIKPQLDFYNRKSDLYPLSHISDNDTRKHTLVTAPTETGKTDFLMKRCKDRIF